MVLVCWIDRPSGLPLRSIYLTDHPVLVILLERQLNTASLRSDDYPQPLSMKSAPPKVDLQWSWPRRRLSSYSHARSRNFVRKMSTRPSTSTNAGSTIHQRIIPFTASHAELTFQLAQFDSLATQMPQLELAVENLRISVTNDETRILKGREKLRSDWRADHQGSAPKPPGSGSGLSGFLAKGSADSRVKLYQEYAYVYEKLLSLTVADRIAQGVHGSCQFVGCAGNSIRRKTARAYSRNPGCQHRQPLYHEMRCSHRV